MTNKYESKNGNNVGSLDALLHFLGTATTTTTTTHFNIVDNTYLDERVNHHLFCCGGEKMRVHHFLVEVVIRLWLSYCKTSRILRLCVIFERVTKETQLKFSGGKAGRI